MTIPHEHTVTALTNESEQGGSSPDPLAPLLEPVLENVKLGVEQFDSGVIPPGGFSIFTFTKPGTYPSYDEFNPSHRGQINVGNLHGARKEYGYENRRGSTI